MGAYTFPDPAITNSLKDWLSTSGELFVELDQPHSGGSGSFYVLNDYPQFEALMENASLGSVCFVLRDKQLPIRGLVDGAFIRRALGWLVDGDDYIMIWPSQYPKPISFAGGGNSHLELERELRELWGTEIWVGRDFEFPDVHWMENFDQNALIITKPK